MKLEDIKTEEDIRKYWDKRIVINGISYRVGKMSYGDWFLEPGPERGEKDGFSPKTIWFIKDKGKLILA